MNQNHKDMENCSIFILKPSLIGKSFLEGIFIVPFAYIIDLFTGGRVSHVGFILDGSVNEELFKTGFTTTSLNTRLAIVPDEENVYIRQPKLPFDNELLDKVREFNLTQKGVLYGLGAAVFTVLDKIPLINKINFGRKKDACSICLCKVMQILDVVSKDIDPFDIDPKELLNLVDKSDLYGPEIKIR
jgi:hypothetical protein